MQTRAHPDRRAMLYARCRQRGLALTVQRRMIIDELDGARDHPSADEVYGRVAGRLPGLSRTTVYRVLEALVRVGVLRRVAHAGVAVRYDPHTERHHHMMCKRCGTLLDVPDEALPRLPLGRVARAGFRVSDYSIHFHGICAKCSRAAHTPQQEKKKTWPRTSTAARRTRT